jgi:hypothetical protein
MARSPWWKSERAAELAIATVKAVAALLDAIARLH